MKTLLFSEGDIAKVIPAVGRDRLIGETFDRIRSRSNWRYLEQWQRLAAAGDGHTSKLERLAKRLMG